jgi:hypothetical protein
MLPLHVDTALDAVSNLCYTVCLLASATQAKRVAQWRQDQQAAATAAAQVMQALHIVHATLCQAHIAAIFRSLCVASHGL